MSASNQASSCAISAAPWPAEHAPAARGGATLTQVANGAIYLIGGANREAESFEDVFEFHNTTNTWQLLEIKVSKHWCARSGHSAVAMGDQIVVFGGLNMRESCIFNDVHVLHPMTKTCTHVDTTGDVPSPRNAHSAVLLPSSDAQTLQMVVFGGSSPETGALNDLFVLHLTIDDENHGIAGRWERMETTGLQPEPREMHVGTFLSSENAIYFSGGRNFDGNMCTDMAILDISTWNWTIVPLCGDWSRCSHAAGLLDTQLVSFGGFDGHTIRGDCCVYDHDQESWVPAPNNNEKDDATQPEANKEALGRFGHAGCEATINGTKGLLVYGGMDAERDLDDLIWITALASS